MACNRRYEKKGKGCVAKRRTRDESEKGGREFAGPQHVTHGTDVALCCVLMTGASRAKIATHYSNE